MDSMIFYSKTTRQHSKRRSTQPYKDTQPPNANTACNNVGLYMHFQMLKGESHEIPKSVMTDPFFLGCAECLLNSSCHNRTEKAISKTHR